MRIRPVIAGTLAALLLFSLSLPACAASPRLVDDADLLTTAEEAALLYMLDEISERQRFDVVVVTVEDIGSQSPMTYADDYYDDNGYRTDGALLLLSMEDRDWYVSTSGYGITAITDEGLDYMSDQFLPDLRRGDYADAFTTFATLCDELVTMAREGNPYGGDDGEIYGYTEPFPFVRYLLTALVLGFLIALITVSIMKGKLKTVRPQNAASDYIRPGSMRLTDSRDLFLYTKVNRRPKPQNTNSGGGHHGGGGVHVSSSGRSHGGGGGKF